MKASAPAELTGQQILCLGTQEWDAHWTPPQQVMSRLVPHNTVVYVEPFRAWVSRFRSGSQVYKRQIAAGVPPLREVQPGLFVYRPTGPYLPWNMKSRLAHALNGVLYKREIERLIGRTHLGRPWLWVYFAQSLTVLDLPFEHIVYDCVDDWPSFFADPRERAHVTYIDEQLTRRAGVVFVGSSPLLEKKRGQNAHVEVVNHAADVQHFARAADPAAIVPADLAAIPRPRIGFVGMVDELRFDGALIETLTRNPAYHVVIVGGFVADAARLLPTRPNVHVLGMKPVKELPAYLKGLDVCTMPYQINETTRYIFPLKLFEYLATGKPVVSTNIPAVQGLDAFVRVARSHDEFVAQVAAALDPEPPDAAGARMAFARQHSWESHVSRKVTVIEQLYAPDRRRT